MPDNFNLKMSATPIATSGASPTQGSTPAAVPAVQTRSRAIAPPTAYNPDTGVVEPVEGGWTGKDGAPEPKAEAAKPEPGKPTRHDQWKAEQKAAREAREAKTAKKTVETQALARDFLKKGDLVGSAKALGMSPAEFREYAQNVLLTAPTPDKELTPEQKRAADEEAFRAEVKTFKAEQEAFRNQTIRSSYIKDKIAPVLADAEKFEFIHNEGLEKMGAYIYDFMNAHYGKTKEELSASDVAEEIEKQLEANFTASVEKARKMKKAAKYFRTEEPEAEPAPALAVEESNEEEVREDMRFPERDIARLRPAPLASRFPARESEPEPTETFTKQAVIRREGSNGAGVPFALLSREERLARIDAENRSARRS